MASDLEKETGEPLLTAIKENAPGANITSLQRLAHAYALTVGAKWGHLPGELDVST